jgi:hypothetical protein
MRWAATRKYLKRVTQYIPKEASKSKIMGFRRRVNWDGKNKGK